MSLKDVFALKRRRNGPEMNESQYKSIQGLKDWGFMQALQSGTKVPS